MKVVLISSEFYYEKSIFQSCQNFAPLFISTEKLQNPKRCACRHEISLELEKKESRTELFIRFFSLAIRVFVVDVAFLFSRNVSSLIPFVRHCELYLIGSEILHCLFCFLFSNKNYNSVLVDEKKLALSLTQRVPRNTLL